MINDAAASALDEGSSVAELRRIADQDIGGNAPWLADELRGFADRLAAEMRGECQMRQSAEPEPDSAAGDGCFAVIAFMGHNEHTGYVTEILKNGQPAYHVDLPEKLWGGNPLAYVEYAASAWFSERPVSEASVRKAWEAQCRRVAERARQEAEWQRAQDQRALTAASEDDHEDDLDDDEDLTWK